MNISSCLSCEQCYLDGFQKSKFNLRGETMRARWEKLKNVKCLEESCGHSAVWVPSMSRVLITGGFNQKHKIKTVRTLNVDVAKVERIKAKSMIYHFSHLAKDGKVYILGASPRSNGLLSYTIYDPKSNEFSKKTYSLPGISHRVGFCAASISENAFLIFGGEDSKNNKVLYDEIYRMEIGTQGRITATPLRRNDKCSRAYAAAAFDGSNRLWIFGGYNNNTNKGYCDEMLFLLIRQNSLKKKKNRHTG